jgi:hypothetical protein
MTEGRRRRKTERRMLEVDKEDMRRWSKVTAAKSHGGRYTDESHS